MAKQLTKTQAKILEILHMQGWFVAESQISKRDYKAACQLATLGLADVYDRKSYHFVSDIRTIRGDYLHVRGNSIHLKPRG